MSFREPYPKLKIVVFDMDGVLVDVRSSWQFIHEAFGKNNLENLMRYERGEITYFELMRSDIALWGHVQLDRIRDILNKVPTIPGAESAFESLRLAGLKTALISAGVSFLADRLGAVLGIDYILANEILADELGFLTWEGVVTVGLLDKLKALVKLSHAKGFSLTECAVVGDSSYDIQMFERAGLSIAFNSNDRNVQKAADIVVNKKDLRNILPYLIPAEIDRSISQKSPARRSHE